MIDMYIMLHICTLVLDMVYLLTVPLYKSDDIHKKYIREQIKIPISKTRIYISKNILTVKNNVFIYFPTHTKATLSKKFAISLFK